MPSSRCCARVLIGVAAASTLAVVGPALAQQAAKRKAAPPPAATQAKGTFVPKRHLVNPSDPIAVVNGEAISRQQLADECVALKGEEVLEAMIGRRLIDQAIRARKIEVSPAEIDTEIERVAQSIAGVSRERWLATLAKERKISPARYAREIIQPGLALKKLAGPLVQVTDKDIADAFEAQFGERLKCRMILLNDLNIAKAVWEDLKKNPALFEKIAQDKSIDPETRSLGGLLKDPIPRHGYPREVFDKVFAQLVDCDPKIKPESPDYEKFRPKDGDLSAIIQVTDSSWAIFRRDSVIPARADYDRNNPELIAQMKASIFDAKLQEKIGEMFADLMRQASIDNLLTGQIKGKGAEEPKSMVERVATPDAAVNRTAGDAATPKLAAPSLPASQPAALAPADARNAETLKLKK